jgi:ferredoxin
MKLWEYTTEITGAEWPKAYGPKSPCPTLKVIESVTSVLGVLEERARMEASRQGEGAKIVADHSLPREERRKHLEQMLLELDKTPTDPKQLEEDMLLTSGMAPVVEINPERSEPVAKPPAQEVIPVVDDPFLEEEGEKEPPQMIPGHELLGDTPVVFQPQNVMTMARVGQPLSEVAKQADVFIKYKCRKGECKTCAVNIDGKWVSACQQRIEPQAPGEHFAVRVRPVSEKEKRQEKVAFFSPESISDGFWNNAWGMFGMVTEGAKSGDDFAVRMDRERRIQELTEKRAKSTVKSLRGTQANTPASADQDGIQQKLGSAATFGVLGFMVALVQRIGA